MPVMPENLMLAPLVKTPNQCLKALANADLIILGPGSFLTSVIPPLLVRDISNALKNRKGHCVFIDNVVAEKSPASQLTLDEKLAWIESNIGCLPIDSVIANLGVTSERVNVINQQLAKKSVPHHHDREMLIKALNVIVKDLKKPPLKSC